MIKNYKAFTLIEPLVVVVIIGILAAVGAVFLNGGSFDNTFNSGFSPALTGNSFRVTACFKTPCADQNNQLQTVISLP